MATISVKNSNPMEFLIRDKLVRQFSPVHLDIMNESYMHNVPKGSETHFKVVVVSNKFENVSLLQVRREHEHLYKYIILVCYNIIFLQRHRLINEILQDELKKGVHALSIVVSNFLLLH